MGNSSVLLCIFCIALMAKELFGDNITTVTSNFPSSTVDFRNSTNSTNSTTGPTDGPTVGPTDGPITSVSATPDQSIASNNSTTSGFKITNSTSKPSSSSPTTASQTTSLPLPATHTCPVPSDTAPAVVQDCEADKKQGKILLMVCGILIIFCVALLVTAMLLAWKVCEQRRMVPADADGELISNTEYWLSTAQRHRQQGDAESRDTTLLMNHIVHSGEEGRSPGEDGGKADGGQKVEEKKVEKDKVEDKKVEKGKEEDKKVEKEEGGSAGSGPAPAGGEARAKEAGSEIPPAKQPVGAEAPAGAAVKPASSPQGSEEPKDVV